MENVLNHVSGLQRLLQMNSGTSLARLQEQQARVVTHMIRQLGSLTVDATLQLSEAVQQVGFTSVRSEAILSTAQDLLGASFHEEKAKTRKSLQAWESFPRFLQKHHWQALLAPKDHVGSLSALANMIILFLISLGLRSPTEGTLGTLTALLAFHDPVRRMDAHALRAGLMQVKAQWQAAASCAPAFAYGHVEKLPESPSALPEELLKSVYGEDMAIVPPVCMQTLHQLSHLVPLRVTNKQLDKTTVLQRDHGMQAFNHNLSHEGRQGLRAITAPAQPMIYDMPDMPQVPQFALGAADASASSFETPLRGGNLQAAIVPHVPLPGGKTLPKAPAANGGVDHLLKVLQQSADLQADSHKGDEDAKVETANMENPEAEIAENAQKSLVEVQPTELEASAVDTQKASKQKEEKRSVVAAVDSAVQALKAREKDKKQEKAAGTKQPSAAAKEKQSTTGTKRPSAAAKEAKKSTTETKRPSAVAKEAKKSTTGTKRPSAVAKEAKKSTTGTKRPAAAKVPDGQKKPKKSEKSPKHDAPHDAAEKISKDDAPHDAAEKCHQDDALHDAAEQRPKDDAFHGHAEQRPKDDAVQRAGEQPDMVEAEKQLGEPCQEGDTCKKYASRAYHQARKRAERAGKTKEEAMAAARLAHQQAAEKWRAKAKATK